MSEVFISYRRQGALKDARALFERLSRELGNDSVFIDLEGIEMGSDWVEVLERQLDGCRVMLALIDSTWATMTDRQGRRRIEREDDFVRLEISAALRRKIPVIPVLIDEVEMPDKSELPDDLRALATRQGLSLDFRRFDAEVARLTLFLRKSLNRDLPGPDKAPAGASGDPALHPVSTPARTGDVQPQRTTTPQPKQPVVLRMDEAPAGQGRVPGAHVESASSDRAPSAPAGKQSRPDKDDVEAAVQSATQSRPAFLASANALLGGRLVLVVVVLLLVGTVLFGASYWRTREHGSAPSPVAEKGVPIGPAAPVAQDGSVAPTAATKDEKPTNPAAEVTAQAVTPQPAAAKEGMASDPSAQLAKGDDYFFGKHGLAKSDTEAVKSYRMAAEQGQATAQAKLGYMYELGRGGLERSDTEAVKWYRKSAAQGSARGQAYLGNMYKLGRGGLETSDTEALKLFRNSADQGDARGQAYLGAMYVQGRGGLERSDTEALRLFRKSADQGDAFGQADLGLMYMQGRGGLERSDTEALKWFRRAADQGEGRGQADLGLMYLLGRGGLENSDTDAVKWFRKAADQGDPVGQTNLGAMYGQGRGGLEKSDTEAAKWYRKAADQGYGPAQVGLGIMYVQGRGGLEKSETEAVKWFRKAADQGDAKGQAELGLMYLQGRGGLVKSDTEAVKWFRKSANQGNSLGQANLGAMYERGAGVEKDRTEARRLYNLAAAQGDNFAAQGLKRLASN
ncbi:MAG TPA: TIR domain-containing protein [Burkholderiaceae bacterium]|nr:TIR domain-containing protein [Burkholderiaceae bacterium]